MKRYLLLTLATASALAMSGTANAAVTIVDKSVSTTSGPTVQNGTTTIGFTDTNLASLNFSEYLTFSNTIAGMYSFTVSTSSPDIDFTNVVLTGAGGPYGFINAVNSGGVEFWYNSMLALDAGQYTLTMDGINRGTGALSGTITIGQAVPEPATWAMMLFGFGAIGFAMRRRKDTSVTKRLRLSYS